MRDRRTLQVFATLVALVFLPGPNLATQDGARPSAPDARVITTDLENFWRLLDRLPSARTRDDSLALLRKEYLEPATECLRDVFHMETTQNQRDVEKELLANLGAYPKYFASLRANAGEIEKGINSIRDGYARLRELYPAMRPADTYLGVAIFNFDGNARECGLYLAAEIGLITEQTDLSEFDPSRAWWVNDPTARLASLPVIAVHEQVHAQQKVRYHRNVLEKALAEGVAEFVTELITGVIGAKEAHDYGNRHEAAVWVAFSSEMQSSDIYRPTGGWFTGPGREGMPGAMGYFVGYQIAAAYYERALDKSKAIQELIEVSDPFDLLEKSGYAGRFSE